MSDNDQQAEKQDNKAPIIIGICAVLVFAFATAVNYGGLFHSAYAAPETVAPAIESK